MSTLQTYSDIKLICDKIERAAILRGKRGDRQSLEVAAGNSLESLSQLIDATEDATQATKKEGNQRGSGSKRKGKEESNTDWGSTWNETWTAESSLESKPCGVEDWEAELNTPGRSFGFEVSAFDAFNRDTEDAMRNLLGMEPGEKLAEGWERCFGCDLRFKFDFQMQPVNLLANLDDLLGQIEGAIDFWDNYSNPYNFLEDFCRLWDMFSETKICIQDWIAILLAIQGLMAKYATMAINVSFDWTVLFGPLLKLILDAVAAMIEQIVQLLTAPIDCAIGVMETIKDLFQEIEDTMNAAVDFGNSIANQAGTLPKISLEKMDVSWEGGVGSSGADMKPRKDEAGEQGWVPSFKENEFSDSSLSGEAPSLDVDKSSWTKNSGSFSSEGSVSIPTGFKMTKGMTLEQAMKDPAFANFADPFDKIIMMLNEAKAWLTKLFSNILFSLKSLNGLVSGGIALNLQSIGMMMLLIDMYNLVRLLMSLDGVKPCQENIEEVAEKMRAVYPDLEFTPNARGNIQSTTKGYESEIKFPDGICSPREKE